MATPIRFAPVLTGNEAIEFYERWSESLKKPDSNYPSEERLKELKEFYRKYALDELNNEL